MTCVRPLVDPVVAGSAAVVTGADLTRRDLPAAVQLDLIRVDPRGRVTRLAPPPGPPPIPINSATPTKPAPAIPIDTVPLTELGLFIPLPAKPATVGATWETADPNRPPVVWSAAREMVWNGGRCVEVTATQQTDGWSRPALAVVGWKRTDVLLTAPADGFASKVVRTIERREGAGVVGWVKVEYELQPPNKHVGPRYDDVRREVEVAYGFLSELAPLLPRADRIDAQQFRSRLVKIDRFLEEPATGFRPALAAARRSCEAASRGEVPPRAIRADRDEPKPLAPGRPAPDFVAPWVHAVGQFRLSAARGKPVVLVFFKPHSKTAVGALAVAEALHKKYADRAAVVALAVSAGADAAERQRDELKLTLPVASGSSVRAAYDIDTYPKFFVVDGAGLLSWQFNGYGPEVGYLVKTQVERLLK
jgi:peroxiredoxin